MDLKHFITVHKTNDTLDSIVDGFEKSSFVEPNSDISSLVKSILNNLITSEESDKQRIYTQLQSGGLAGPKSKTTKKETSKKQSYCTEFNQMISNILGLLGSEFSKYLFIYMGIKHLIAKEIELISNAQDYDTILRHVIYIKNFMNLGDYEDYTNLDSNNESPIDIDASFYDRCNVRMVRDSLYERQNYLEMEVKLNQKNLFFNQLIKNIRLLIKSENVLSFESDRAEWTAMLHDMLKNTTLRTYVINNIDDLCMNLSNKNLGYDKSFIKMFEILYKESFADIPFELWDSYKPHIIFIENELKLDIKSSKYLASFNSYFHKIYEETLKSVSEVFDRKDILQVKITNAMYELLSDITFNLFVNISKKIANNQITQAYFGKSTRIQFIQMFQAVNECCPRLSSFSRSQRMMLHYILLSHKVLVESVQNLNMYSSKT